MHRPNSRPDATLSAGQDAGGFWVRQWQSGLGWLRRFLLLVGLLWPATAGWGAERFPPPEFDSGYTFPATTTPAPRAAAWEYVDVAVLLGALAASVYVVHRKRSRRQIFYLVLFSLLYFGFYRKGCICPIGSIQNVTLAWFDPGYTVPLSVAVFFLLPLLFTLVAGRTFCAAVCPLGAIQDVVHVRTLKVPAWLERGLGVLPYVYLGAAVLFAATGSAFIICDYDPFIAIFRRGGSLNLLLLGAGFLLVGLFLGRPYCRFLCPYGALLRVLGRFSKWKVTLTPDDCIHCQLCEVACPYGAIQEPGEKTAPGADAGSTRRRIGYAVLLPVLVLAGAWMGYRLSDPFSRVHPTVRLAERIAGEDTGQIQMLNDTEAVTATNHTAGITRNEETLRLASKAFRQQGRPASELYADALRVRGEFRFGGWLFGAFVGLVIGVQLLALALSPEPTKAYDPDPGRCVACGRCYTYCPKEIIRVKRVQRGNVIPLTPA